MALNVERPDMTVRTSVSEESTASQAARSGVSAFMRERKGVTAIEYGIIAGLVAVVIVGAINTLGQTALTQLFDKVASSL